MGSQIRIFSTGASCFLKQNHPSNMKAFVAMFAAVAAAAAEPWGYGLYGAPLVYGIGESVPCAAGHPEYRRAYNVIAKREAESDPTLYFVNPVGHRYGFPHNGFGQELIHSSNLGVCTNYLGQ